MGATHAGHLNGLANSFEGLSNILINLAALYTSVGNRNSGFNAH